MWRFEVQIVSRVWLSGCQGKLLQTASQQNLLLLCLLESKIHAEYSDCSGSCFRCFFGGSFSEDKLNYFSVGVLRVSKAWDPAGGVLSPGQRGGSPSLTPPPPIRRQPGQQQAAGRWRLEPLLFLPSLLRSRPAPSPDITNCQLSFFTRRRSSLPKHPFICLSITSFMNPSKLPSFLTSSRQWAEASQPAVCVCVCVYVWVSAGQCPSIKPY